jgi:APA family basic amino acid/polyamine antiporter
MSVISAGRGPRLLIKKSIAQIQGEATNHQLKRTLGPINLVSLGVGCIIGAGIFVLTGDVASHHAGPAILISFIIAGFVCALAGLCYAELSSTMPVSGSAYTYAYGTMGEVFAWIMGWLLVLEYGVAASEVAVGWAGYVVSLLKDFGIALPNITVAGLPQPQWATPLITAQANAAGITSFQLSGTFNLIAAAGIGLVGCLLVIGVSESAKVNNVIVCIKVTVLLAFILIGLPYVNPANWHPFLPKNTGETGSFGISGVLQGAAIIFFAYVGFEAVSTAAAEAKNPKKDVPIGILGSLFICTAIYMVVAAVMTGIVPFKELGVPDPIAIAVDRMHPTWAQIPAAFVPAGHLNLFSLMIKVGAVTGLSSVMLVLYYGQTRIFYSMARDGLLPPAFAVIHNKFKTPWIGTITLGVLIAISAAFLPIDLLNQLVSLGTALAFSIVCLSVISLRRTHPDLPRAFRVPGGVPTAAVGIVVCLGMAAFNLLPMVDKAAHGDFLPLGILVGYGLVGVAVYLLYGLGHSKLAKGIDILDIGPGPEEAFAPGHGGPLNR